MINSVTVTNYLGESIKLELRFPERSGFLVQEITGLGPAKANINMTQLPTDDGALFNSARMQTRNIVMRLLFLEKPTVDQTRQMSYKYFPVKKPITLVIETETRSCRISGYVESNELNIFSATASTQISILCPDPYFYDLETNTTVFSGVEPQFTFPFSNESLVDPLISFGELQMRQEQTVYYDGDSEIGMIIRIHALGTIEQLVIYTNAEIGSLWIDTDILFQLMGTFILNGDDIIISTIKGRKSITLIRDGVYYNILNALGRESNWFQLHYGDNVFSFSAAVGGDKVQFQIENQKIYEGV